MSFGVFNNPEVPDRNITTLTTGLMDYYLKPTNETEDFEDRLIEGVSTSRYKIGGENSGSFIYVSEKKDGDFKIAWEWVITIHNNQVYQFAFSSDPRVFDTPRINEIRKHMFDSIKWLDDS